MTKHVYSFGNGTADGDGKMKDTLGGKGAGLAEMCRAKLPVPPGFTISTQVCNIYFDNNFTVPAEVDERGREGLARFIAELDLDLVATRLLEIKDKDGPDAIAVLSSARCTNEENYLLQRLTRAGLNTNSIDHCART